MTYEQKKNFIFIRYSSDSVGLQTFIEIQGGHVNCCVDCQTSENMEIMK
jgi:hypothetical protein